MTTACGTTTLFLTLQKEQGRHLPDFLNATRFWFLAVLPLPLLYLCLSVNVYEYPTRLLFITTPSLPLLHHHYTITTPLLHVRLRLHNI